MKNDETRDDDDDGGCENLCRRRFTVASVARVRANTRVVRDSVSSRGFPAGTRLFFPTSAKLAEPTAFRRNVHGGTFAPPERDRSAQRTSFDGERRAIGYGRARSPYRCVRAGRGRS